MGRRVTRVDLEANVTVYRRDVRGATGDTNELRRTAERFSKGKYGAKAGVDTKKGHADLAALDRAGQRFDGNDYVAHARIDGTARASRQMSALIDFGFMLGPAFIAGGGAAAGALAGVAGSATMALGAVGPLALAFSGVGEALEAMEKVRDESAQNARDQARTEVLAARSIADARRNLTRTVSDAAYDQEQAERSVTDAEHALADAHRDVDDALDELHEARQQAIRDLQDMREQQGDNNLSIEAAKIRLIEARQELARLATAEGTTALDMRKARLTVREAEDALSDAKREARRDTDDLRQAERDGIRDSDRVVDARDNVKSAHDRVREAQDAVRQAQENAARTELQALRDIADAERVLRRAVEDANFDLSQQTTQMQNLRQEMADLSPEGRHFVRFLDDLRPKLQRLKDAAQAGLLPGAEKGITELMEVLPELEEVVESYSSALGQLAEEGGDALNDPFWRDYFEFLDQKAHGSVVRMGRAVGNFVEGFAALHEAFFPLQKDMEQGVLGWSRAFNRWAKNLDDTERFQDFLDYVERVGPKVMDVVEAVADALLAVVDAAAPIGEATLPIIEGLARLIERIARSEIGTPLIAMAAGLAAVNRAMRVMEAAQYSNLGLAIGSIGSKSKTTAGRLDLLKSSARGVAGVAGLGALIGSTQTASDEMSTFLSIAGGTATGAAIGSTFGPWGTAIGGAAGAVFGLATALGSSGDNAEEAQPQIQSYIDTLDELSGAATKATRAEVARRLEEEGLLEIARQAGIPLKEVVDAVITGDLGSLAADLFDAYEAGKLTTSQYLEMRDALDANAKQIRDDVEARQRITEAERGWGRSVGDVTDRIVGNDDKAARLAKTIERLERKQYNATGQAKLHEDQLRRVAEKLGLNYEQTERLIEGYDHVPPSIYTKAQFDDKSAREKTSAWVRWVQDQWGKLDRITVSAGFFGEQTGHVTHGGGHGQFYAGGYTGPGGKHEPAGIVHRDEFVIASDSRRRLESEAPGSLDYMNRTGAWPGYIDGGRVAGPTVKVQSDFGDLRQAVREFVAAMSMAGGRWVPGVSDRRVGYSGVTLDYYTFQRLRAAEKMIGQRFDLTQGSFSTSVAASGGTHAGGGAFDADSPFTRAAVVALRKYGVAAWRRYPSQGPWGTHIHGIALGDRIASAEAKQQMRDYLAGGDGLGGRDYEPRPNVILPVRSGGGQIAGSARAAKRYALSLFPTYNWNPSRQWGPLDNLWTRESNWDYKAVNQSSGAGGIPQALPPSKMGAGWQTDPAQQVRWGLGYIHDRYRTPVRAWAHSQSTGWYDDGGTLPPVLPWNGTGKPEQVLTNPERDAFRELGQWAHITKVQATTGAAGPGGGLSGQLQGTFRIVNWQQGVVFFRGIAADTVDGNTQHAATLARMG